MGVVTLKGEEEIFLSLSLDTCKRKCHVRTQQEVSCLQAWKEASRRTALVSLLTLDLQASRTVRNKLVLFKPPSLWYFVNAAQAY